MPLRSRYLVDAALSFTLSEVIALGTRSQARLTLLASAGPQAKRTMRVLPRVGHALQPLVASGADAVSHTLGDMEDLTKHGIDLGIRSMDAGEGFPFHLPDHTAALIHGT